MTVLRCSAFSLLLLMLLITNAFAGGFTFDGLGVKARGMGGAFRALADDWSAAYYNPAGYARIQDNTIAGNLAVFNNRYSLKPDVLWGGEYETGYLNGQEIYDHHANLNVPEGGILARLPIWGETVWGFSIMQLFDQNQSWELYRNLQAYSQMTYPHLQYYNNLDVVAFQLTAAREFMDEKLSVGLGLALLRGDLIYNSVVLWDNPIDGTNYRPYEKIPQWYNNDGMGWGFGFRIGALYSVNDKIDVGLVFSGPASIKLSGETHSELYLVNNLSAAQQYTEGTEERYFLSGGRMLGNADFETTLDLPATIGVGAAMRVNEKLTVDLDLEYTFWSRFKGFDFDYNNYTTDAPTDSFTNLISLIETNISVPQNWDDAGRMMLGANYKLEDFVELRAGFSVDQTVSSDITQIPQFMDLYTKYSYSMGVGFEAGFWHLDLAMSYTHHGDAAPTTMSFYNNDNLMDNLPGYYEADVYQTVLGISYRF
jgi:long-chain fatty acid transport protein